MMRVALFLTILVLGRGGHANCSAVPLSVKNAYASAMFEAFITQSYGKSTIAFCQFDTAREQAKKAGENTFNLIAIEQLFAWYRMYGSSLRLFYKNPVGNDRIHGEYKPSGNWALLGAYDSEWGHDPEQARIMREFMFGVGQVIAGVFCATVSGGVFGLIAGGVATDGCFRIYSSLNALWAHHQTELIALKKWEQTALRPALK